MRKITIKERFAFPLVVNGTNILTIDTPEDLTNMDLLIKVPVTVAALAAPAADGLQKLIRGISLINNKGETLVRVTNTRALIRFNALLSHSKIRVDTLPTVAGNYDLLIKLTLHAGREFNDIFDDKIIFPGHNSASYKIELGVGVAADLGTGYSFNGALSAIPVLAQINYEYPTTERAELFRLGVPVGNMVTESTPINGAVANMGQVIDIPVGRLLTRSLIMATNAAGEPSDAIIDRFCIRFPRAMGQTATDISWTTAKELLRSQYPNLSNESMTGIYMVDWSTIQGAVYESGAKAGQNRTSVTGYDTNGALKGDIEFGLSTLAAGSVTVLNHYIVIGD